VETDLRSEEEASGDATATATSSFGFRSVGSLDPGSADRSRINNPAGGGFGVTVDDVAGCDAMAVMSKARSTSYIVNLFISTLCFKFSLFFFSPNNHYTE
jgi:hypothetical protein